MKFAAALKYYQHAQYATWLVAFLSHITFTLSVLRFYFLQLPFSKANATRGQI